MPGLSVPPHLPCDFCEFLTFSLKVSSNQLLCPSMLPQFDPIPASCLALLFTPFHLTKSIYAHDSVNSEMLLKVEGVL